MTARKDHFRVTVVAPGPGDGPNWQHVIRGPGVRPKRVSSGTTDRAAAEAEAVAMAARMNSRLAPPRREDPLAIVVMDRHVAFRETDTLTAPSTLAGYVCARAAFALPLEGVHASGLTKNVLEDVQQHLLNRSERPLAPATVNLYMEKLKHAWEWAHGKGHPSVSLWPGVEPLIVERTAKRQHRPAELERLLIEAGRYGDDGRLVPLLCLLADIGPRVSEPLALRGRDIDLEAGTVTLQTPKTRRRGGRRSRTVAVSPDVLAMLPERKSDEWVFRSVTDPDRPLAYSTVQGAFATIRERAGLAGEPIDLHSFRRYAIRKVHTAGVPLKDAMDFFGHASVRAHMVYMTDLATPGEQRAILARARAVHDPMAALPGRVPGRVAPEAELISCGPNAPDPSGRKARKAPGSGQTGRKSTRHLDGSKRAKRGTSVVELSRDPRAARLGRLLTDLAPANRQVVIEAFQDEDLRESALVAARVEWPHLVKPEAKPARRESRNAR